MSRSRWGSSIVVAGGCLAALFLFHTRSSLAGSAAEADYQARIAKGFAITPVPLDLRGKDPDLVGLGSYIVNAVSACNDCHSNPSYDPAHNPFKNGNGWVNAAGYLKGGKDFGNGIVAPALTPDARGLPGGLTLEQFARSINTGVDPDDPNRILQIMPWPVYRNMTQEDQRAVYEYLRALPAAPPKR